MDNRSGLMGRLEEIKRLAEEIRRNSPKLQPEALAELLPKLLNEMSDLVSATAKNPRALGTWIEAQSPWLSRRFLGAASNIAEPFTLGMGLKILALSEDVIEVEMPGFWRNQGESGQVHSGALSVLGEFTSRLYWEHHLDLRHSEMALKSLQIRVLSRAQGLTKAIYRTTVGERESALHRLRSEGQVEMDSLTSIYDESGRLVAEAEAVWEFQRQLALQGNQNKEN